MTVAGPAARATRTGLLRRHFFLTLICTNLPPCHISQDVDFMALHLSLLVPELSSEAEKETLSLV